MKAFRNAERRQPLALLSAVLTAVLTLASTVDRLPAADDSESAEARAFKFAARVFRSKCVRCHGSQTRKGDLDLSSLETLLRGGESGPVLDREHPEKSTLLEHVRDRTMPPEGEGRLTDVEIQTILKWGLDAARNEASRHRDEISQHTVLPSLQLRCGACHGRNKQEAGLDIRSKASLLRGGQSGPAIVPGAPEDSRLLQRIHAEEMPPRKSLIAASVKPMPQHEIRNLTKWIAAGAPELDIKPDVMTTEPDPLVSDADRRFWAFQTPTKPDLPAVQNSARVRSPIDTFLLHRLEEHNLTFNPQADRHTLIRRAKFDLHGLPPSPEEIETFVHDSRPGAFARLVERLLQSPRYGERWGQHWLDLAGYSDSEGVQHADVVRKHGWRYRDYVIRAFNADKPYDRFLLEQIAGDELADYENAEVISQELYDNLVATGFLRQAPDGTYEPLTGFVPDRLELIDDEIEILSSAVMGLTIKCARCHSHRFDPIPQRDYYRLAAVFKGAFDQHGWLKPTERLLPFVQSDELQRWKAAGAKEEDRPRIRALFDRGDPSATYVLKRGNYMMPGRLVGPGVPSVLTDGRTPFVVSPPWSGSKKTGRRLAFTKWLTRADHPLTARVIVNRIWKHHFGRGLVATLDNFGRAGARPTHPELLDWLAVTLTEDKWSLKSLHRRILNSAAWRQSSTVLPQHARFDPDNQWYARMPLRRMEGEVVRDALLAVAGRLELTMYGPADAVTARSDGLVTSVPWKDGRNWRRSIYVLKRRTQPVTLLQNFDVSRMAPNCVERPVSIVAPQALHLKNNKWVRQMSASLRDRIVHMAGDDRERQIRAAWNLVAGREPEADEFRATVASLDRLTREWTSKKLGTRHELKATAHLWIRESEPERVFEDDLISVWSSNSSDKARRRGLLEFDLAELEGFQMTGANLHLGVLDSHPIRQSAHAIPAGIAQYNWQRFEANKAGHTQQLEGLGRFDSAESDVPAGSRLACAGATPADLLLLHDRITSDGRLTLMLEAEEDGNAYHRDWDDGVYRTTRGNPPLLIVYDSRPDPQDSRRRALHDFCHAMINSAAFLYID